MGNQVIDRLDTQPEETLGSNRPHTLQILAAIR
jgi:hypothetical protein